MKRLRKDPLHNLKSYRPAFREQAKFMADEKRIVGLVANAQSGKTYSAAPKFLSRVYKSQQKRNGADMRYWIIVKNILELYESSVSGCTRATVRASVMEGVQNGLLFVISQNKPRTKI